MRFVKILLWLILSLCVMWAAAVIFGPFLISTAAKNFFDKRVVLGNVRITPKLSIEIDQLDFEIDTAGSPAKYGGSVRALTLDLRQKNLRPSFDLKFGTIEIEEILFLQGVTSTVDFKTIWGFSEGKVEASVKKSSTGQFFTAENIVASMTFADTFRKLASVEVELENPNIDQFSLSSKSLKIYIDEYYTFEKFNGQSSNVRYQLMLNITSFCMLRK